MTRVEESAVKPLEEAQRIDQGRSCKVSFTNWLNDAKRHMTYHCIDSVGFILVEMFKMNSMMIRPNMLGATSLSRLGKSVIFSLEMNAGRLSRMEAKEPKLVLPSN
jgi:hypothetical protein